jgi:hypothetical protein
MGLAAEAVGLCGAPSSCPGCHTVGKVVPIVYGFHTAKAEERSRQGKVVLGMFSAGRLAPRWECLICGTKMR